MVFLAKMMIVSGGRDRGPNR